MQASSSGCESFCGSERCAGRGDPTPLPRGRDSMTPRIAPLALTLLACADPGTTPTPDAVATALPTLSLEGGSAHWAGAPFTVRMRGTGARPLDARLVLSNQVEVSMVYLDDSTLVGDFPPTTRGIVHTPRVTYLGSDTLLAPITIHGPTAHASVWWNFPPGYLHSPAYPVGSGRLLIAATDWYATYLPWNEFNGAARATVPERPIPHQMLAPGPTPDPDTWLFRSTPGGPLERWSLRPAPRLLETLPFTGSGSAQSYAALGSDRLVAFNATAGQVLRRNGNGYVPERTLFLEHVTRTLVSPSGDRVAIVGSRGVVSGPDPNGSNEIPVLRAPEGDPAFTLEAAVVASAGFSPDGALLALAEGSAVHLIGGTTIRDAVSGTVVRHLASDMGPVRGVAFDPARPIIYQLTLIPGGPDFHLQAWSTDSWALLGRMRGRCHHGCVGEMQIVADSGNTVFTVEQHPTPGGDEMVSYRFSVPRVR